ncbi:porin [Saccharophagus sp. K07]|jgi:hypothetical protein|uniref:porin n=1 Tax=Saccharophagus sp. K07 TaxID=2283636 RepID=UPI001651D39B|nr:porin [Saccharophagus sp. K07]MBC6907176.1 porin [Saccharophagus sp. K07]
MKKQIWRCTACSLALGLAAQTVNAADIQFRGFASFVGGSTLSSDDTLYDYDDTLNFRHESLMALQVDAKLDEKLKATMQIIGRGENSYDPVIEWAYLTYDISEQLQVSAGRIRIPFYRYSDFIDVRYAYNWINVPQTVYGLEFPGYDGLSFVYNNQLGSWDSTLQVIYGQFEGEAMGYEANLENLSGINWTVTRDWLTLRAGYMRAKATILITEYEQLASGVELVGGLNALDLSVLGSDIRLDGDDGDFLGLAVGIDRNNFLFDVEYIQYKVSDSLLADTDAYYVSAGYRFGKWIPLLTYSKSKSDAPREVLNGIPSAAADILMNGVPLPLYLAGAASQAEDETTLIDLTLRYDFHHSAAFKIALTEEEDKAGEKNRLLRFGVDLVF